MHIVIFHCTDRMEVHNVLHLLVDSTSDILLCTFLIFRSYKLVWKQNIFVT